jgi:hypothetical protein
VSQCVNVLPLLAAFQRVPRCQGLPSGRPWITGRRPAARQRVGSVAQRAGGHPPAATETGEPKVILTALCGHGHLDLAAYAAFLSGELTDHELQTEEITQYLAGLPEVPASA